MSTVDREGVTIYYELHGSDGDPVLLLMGLGVDSGGWELQLPAFSARHRTVVVDNRGMGRSGRPPAPYTITEMAEDARAVLDALGLARAHVVGVSMGGMIAQELALRHPKRVGALVLASTYARPGRDIQSTTEAGSRSLTGGTIDFIKIMQGGFDLSKIDVRQVMGFFMPLVFSGQFLVEKRDYLIQLFARAMTYGFSMQAFLGQIAAVMAHDTVARLPSIESPTLVLTGTADRLVPPSHAEEIARHLPNGRLVHLEGGTHGVNFEDPERWNQVVLEFLAGHALP